MAGKLSGPQGGHTATQPSSLEAPWLSLLCGSIPGQGHACGEAVRTGQNSGQVRKSQKGAEHG